MRLSIRPATADDREWLYLLHQAAMRERVEVLNATWDDASQRQRFFGRSEPDVRIVESDGVAVGAVHLDHDADGSLRIGLIEIHPAHQRRGIGTRVIETLDEEAARAGVDLTLRVRHGNEARRLYERTGFVAESEDSTHVHMRRR